MAEFRKIKLGVFGAGRGRAFMKYPNEPIGLELVAICDKNTARAQSVKNSLNMPDVALYEDFDEFLKHPDMEAVMLANYFNEHAPYAIKAMKAGKHVLSECAACSTLKEGIELCETVEETGKIYMFAENYPYTAFNQEMRRLYQTGEIGEVMYAEGEYNHPATGSGHASYPLTDGPYHWRLWNPTTYYCTHGIAPLMYITDTMPKSVNAVAVALDSNVAKAEQINRIKDEGAVSMVRMDNGSIFRLMGTGIPGHSIWYRVHGNRGAMEASRGKGYFGPGEVRVWHEPLHLTGEWANTPSERTYYPSWPAFADKIASAGHGGGDFWVNYHFAEAIRNNEQPYLNVYRGCAMSAVGICGWLSALNNGAEVEIPDFADKVAREKFRTWDKRPYHETYETTPEKWLKPSIVGPDDYEYYLKAAFKRCGEAYPPEKK